MSFGRYLYRVCDDGFGSTVAFVFPVGTSRRRRTINGEITRWCSTENRIEFKGDRYGA